MLLVFLVSWVFLVSFVSVVYLVSLLKFWVGFFSLFYHSKNVLRPNKDIKSLKIENNNYYRFKFWFAFIALGEVNLRHLFSGVNLGTIFAHTSFLLKWLYKTNNLLFNTYTNARARRIRLQTRGCIVVDCSALSIEASVSLFYNHTSYICQGTINCVDR